MADPVEIVRWAAMIVSLLLAAAFVAVVAIDHRRRLMRQFSGGSSPAGAGYDAASEIEAQLPWPGTMVGTDVLLSSEATARVRVNVHKLRQRHVCHGYLIGQTGVSPLLRCAAAHRLACESASWKRRPMQAGEDPAEDPTRFRDRVQPHDYNQSATPVEELRTTQSGGVALRPDAGGGRPEVPSGSVAVCTRSLPCSREEWARG